MKNILSIATIVALSVVSFQLTAQTNKTEKPAGKAPAKNYYLDIHQLQPGKVKLEDVADAHAKDLAVEKKYGAHFIKYWVNEDEGKVMCLVSASDSSMLRKTHAEAHGLLPDHIYKITSATANTLKSQKNLYLDVHYLGAGKITAKDGAEAHKKDLAVQGKYGVNFIDYWVDEKEGTVRCLVEAKDSASISQAHKEAHGLIPANVTKVKLGK
jgi:uncharacterized protein DUF4242